MATTKGKVEAVKPATATKKAAPKKANKTMKSEIEKIVNERLQQITGMGLKWNDREQSYLMDDINIHITEIKVMGMDAWDELILKIETEIERRKANPSATTAALGLVIDLDKGNKPTDVVGAWNPSAAIAAFQARKGKIAEMVKKYDGIVIADINDKVNINLVKEGKKLLRSERTSIEAERKAVKSPAIKFGETVDSAAMSLTLQIEPTESKFDIELDKLKGWEEAAEKEKAEAAAAERDRRVNILIGCGMVFNGSYYVVGDGTGTSMGVDAIQSMTEFNFNALVEKVKIEKKKLDEQAETDRLKKEQEEKEQREKEATLRAEQEKLEKEKAAFEKEKEEMRKQKLAMREAMCKAIGMSPNATGTPPNFTVNYSFSNEFASVSISSDQLTSMDSDEFNTQMKAYEVTITQAKSDADKKAQKDRELRERYDLRVNTLVNLGMVSDSNRDFNFKLPDIPTPASVHFNELRDHSDDQWNITLNAASSHIEKIKEAQQAITDQRAKEKQEREDREKKVEEAYRERIFELNSLNMVTVGMNFIRKNEFGDLYTISAAEVKATDPDMWSGKLQTIKEGVADINSKTETKRTEQKQKDEARKPQIQRTREYLTNILNVPKPEVEDVRLKNILLTFIEDTTAAMNKANTALLAVQ